jgi:hypothetical protein
MSTLRNELKIRRLRQVDLARHLQKSKQYVNWLCSNACYLDGNIIYSKTQSKGNRLSDNIVLKGVSEVLDRV